jgi:hypothetical protein
MNNCYIIHRSKDVLNIIFNKLPFRSQLRFRATCKKFREKLDITDLYNIPFELRERLTDKIVLQYPKLHELYAWNNPKITNKSVKKLKQLRKLNASFNKKITNKSVKKLKQLHTLNAMGNQSITEEGTNHIKKVYL